MYCPVCRSEFLEGFTECNECKVPLVDVLPPEPEKQPDGWLGLFGLIAAIGMGYVFLVKTMGSFIPGIFQNTLFTRANVVVFTLVELALLLFFVFFLKDYVKKEQGLLRLGTLVAIAGSALVFIARIYGIASVYNLPDLSMALYDIQVMKAVLPFTASFSIFIFMLTFYIELNKKAEKKDILRSAVSWAVWGTLVASALNLFALLNHFIFKLPYQAGSSGYIILAVVSVPLLLFATVTLILFLLVMYKRFSPRGQS